MLKTPSILFIGGHDPVGGAGLQADFETACALACRAYSLVTCLTTQDSRNVLAVHPQPVLQLQQQLDLLLDDVEPDLVKVGLLGDAELATMLAGRLADFPGRLVFDPVLAAGGGRELSGERLLAVIREHWLPLSWLLTPNREEARRIADRADSREAAAWLLGQGCSNLLLTGADEADAGQVHNILMKSGGETIKFTWPLLPHSYHGSGCTLASACACHLARGLDLAAAAQAAQAFVQSSLARAERPGAGQHLPSRWPQA